MRGRIPASEIAVRERELLGIARALFLERGFDGVTVESLSRAARVSPKTLYGRYGGKDGLFLAAIRPKSDLLVAMLDAAPKSTRHVERLLASFGDRLLAVTLAPDALRTMRLLIGEAPRFPALARTFNSTGPARGIAALATLFVKADEAGFITCRAPREAAEFFLGALLGERLRAGLLIGETPDAGEIRARARAAARMLVSAYRTR